MLALWGANTFFGGNVLGMFIFPALIALVIGVAGLFIGKDDPEELGWNRCEEIFGEPVEAENAEADEMPMWQAFKQFVLRNPWIWILCIANVFVISCASASTTGHRFMLPKRSVSTSLMR